MAVSAPNATETTSHANAGTTPGERYQPPTFEVICLACEISSYAPDGDDRPLF